MLADSGRIQESDAQFVNKKLAERGEPPIEPLYTEADAERAAALFHPIDYNQPFAPVPGVVARFIEAGHRLQWQKIDSYSARICRASRCG